MKMIRKILNEFSEAVFPSNIYCISCGSLIDRSRPYSLCDKCLASMQWIAGGNICDKCGKALQDRFRGNVCYDCMSQERIFTKGFSCLTYGLHERELMMDIKYSSKGYMANKMGDILYDRFSSEVNLIGSVELFDVYAKEDFFIGRRDGIIVDVIVPVPVSRGRIKKRGYNQSALMARRLFERWMDEIEPARYLSNGIVKAPTYDGNVLYRVKETKMLRSLNPTQRSVALKGAFRVKSERSRVIFAKNILLVDDIYTTGATCDACANTLFEAGAKNVYVLTLCSGGNKKPSE